MGLENLLEPALSVLAVLEPASQFRPSQRVGGVDPESERRDRQARLQCRDEAGPTNYGTDTTRLELSRQPGALIVPEAEDSNVARLDSTRLARGLVANARLGIGEQHADARGEADEVELSVPAWFSRLIVDSGFEHPTLEDGTEALGLPGNAGVNANKLRGDPRFGERGSEELRGEADELRAAAVGAVEGLGRLSS